MAKARVSGVTNREDGHLAIFEQLQTRRVRKRRLAVHEYSSPKPKRGSWPLALPGTVTLILAKSGSKILADVDAAVRGGGSGADLKLAQRLIDGITRKIEKKEPWAAKANAMLKQPVWGDLRYGGKTLAQALWVPDDVEAAVAVFPYTGARLLADGFSLVEHVAADSTAALDAILLVNTPELSAAERALHRLATEDELEQVVGEAIHGDCWECAADYAQYAAVAAIVLTFLLVCFEPPFDPDTVVDPEKLLQKNAPIGSLIALRRQLLVEQMKLIQGQRQARG